MSFKKFLLAMIGPLWASATVKNEAGDEKNLADLLNESAENSSYVIDEKAIAAIVDERLAQTKQSVQSGAQASVALGSEIEKQKQAIEAMQQEIEQLKQSIEQHATNQAEIAKEVAALKGTPPKAVRANDGKAPEGPGANNDLPQLSDFEMSIINKMNKSKEEKEAMIRKSRENKAKQIGKL